MAVLDRMEKTANIRLLQIEINDLYGACIKVSGPVSDLESALAGRARTGRVDGRPRASWT